jgi:archaeosine synthase
MDFYIKKTDGPARIGEIQIDKKVKTPNILFIDIDRFQTPDYAEITISKDKIRSLKPKIIVLNNFFYQKDLSKISDLSEIKTQGKKDSTFVYIIRNALQLFQQTTDFINFIITLRGKIGNEKIIYTPVIGDPNSFSLLTYLGIDLFDSTSAIIAARNNILLFPDGKYHKNELKELPCNCPICNKIKTEPSKMSFQQILNHNYQIIINEIKNVRNAINNNNLRDLVEKRVISNPSLLEILRKTDDNHYNFLEKKTPVTSNTKIYATSQDSLKRPEIKRFQERVLKRYKKPKSTKILLLLPCSARKPYSFSKSHKFFIEQIRKTHNPHVIHEMIITSPMGLVPRELELVYPASSYDIPITGIWFEDEKKMIKDLLKTYLENNKYDQIIVHLPREITVFIKELLKKPIITCVDKPTSDESLNKLFENLDKATDQFKKVETQRRLMENMYSLLCYQFGEKTAKTLSENCQIRGKYPNYRIMSNKTQLGMLVEKRGFISLTLDGAKRIQPGGSYWIEISDDFTLKGSVFAPGVKNADESTRIGDEAIILQKNKVVGVGVALMNGKDMKENMFGEAVKIRHHV